MDVETPPKPEPGDVVPHKRPRSDSDSSISVDESIHSTRTLRSEDFNFVSENGRLYGNASYWLPCDQAEQDRLAIQHQVFLRALKGKLHTAPITKYTRRILDLGTGPGDWAIAMAKQYPFAEVVGVDMSIWELETTDDESEGGQVTWEIDDLDVWGTQISAMEELSSIVEQYDPFHDPTHREPSGSKRKSLLAKQQQESQPQTPMLAEPPPPTEDHSIDIPPLPAPGWHFSEPFDLIHLRNMKGAFTDWEDVYAEIYKSLSTGGYVEIVDYEVQLPDMLKVPSTSFNTPPNPSSQGPETTATPDAAYALPTCRALYLLMMSSSFRAGRPLGTFYLHPSYLEDAGFKDVRTTYVNVPIGQWSDDPEQRALGKMFLVVLMESFEAILLRLGTRWGPGGEESSPERLRKLIELGKRELLEWNEWVGGVEEVDTKGKGKGKVRRVEGHEWCATFKWVVGRKPE